MTLAYPQYLHKVCGILVMIFSQTIREYRPSDWSVYDRISIDKCHQFSLCSAEIFYFGICCRLVNATQHNTHLQIPPF